MLKKLEKLTISNNFLSTLPSNFHQLTSLTSLHCANNRFVEIPRAVTSLRKLQFLDFSSNRLVNLPHGEYMVSISIIIQYVSLDKVQIKKLTIYSNEDKLITLYLQFNKLSATDLLQFPDIGELNGLTSLILSYNHLQSLPDSICKLSELRTLWLSGNRLSSLPKDFGRLRMLDWEVWCASSVLDENPLQDPPLRVAKLGSHAINRYFERQQNRPLKIEQTQEPQHIP